MSLLKGALKQAQPVFWTCTLTEWADFSQGLPGDAVRTPS